MLKPVPQELLDIANKTRSNLFAWRGQFTPQLVEVLVKAYAPARGFILDPFVGSGTVLYEAGRLGYEALGTEINPAATAFARIYGLINLAREERNDLIHKTEARIASIAFHELPLLLPPESSTQEPNALDRLIAAVSACTTPRQLTIIEALVTLLDVYNNNPGPAFIRTKWNALKSLVMALPFSPAPIRSSLCDARNLPIPDSSVDFGLRK